MSATSSDDPTGERPGAAPRRPSAGARWLPRLVLVAVLALLGVFAAVLVPVVAPGFVLRQALALARSGLPADVTLEVASLEAASLARPRLAGVRLELPGGVVVELSRLDLSWPVGATLGQVLGLTGPAPLDLTADAGPLTLSLPGELRLALRGLAVDLRARRGPPPAATGSLRAEQLALHFEGVEVAALEAARLELREPDADGALVVAVAAGPGRVATLPATRLAAGLAARAAEAPEGGAAPVRLAELRVHDLQVATQAGAPSLVVTRAALLGEAGEWGLPSRLEAAFRVEGGGGGEARLRVVDGRVRGELDLVDLDLARLPLPLEPDITVTGRAGADLSVDLSLAAPEDLSRCRGRAAVEDLDVRRDGIPLAQGGDLSLELAPERASVRGRLAQLWPARLDARVASWVTSAPPAALELDVSADARGREGRVRLDWTGEVATVAEHTLRDASLAATWTTRAVEVQELRVARRGGGRAHASGVVELGEGWAPRRSRLVAELVALPAEAVAPGVLEATASVGASLRATVPMDAPLALRAMGELRLAGAPALGATTAAPLRLPLRVAPARLEVGPLERRFGGVSLEASLRVTDVAVLAARFGGAGVTLPRLGPVRLDGRARARAQGLSPGPGSVLARWVGALSDPSTRESLSLHWNLDELDVRGESGVLLSLRDALRGRLDASAGSAEVDPLEAEVLEARVTVDGVVGPRPGDRLQVDVRGVPLVRVADLVAPGSQVSVQGDLGAALGLRALLGSPFLEGTLDWTGDPSVSLWQRDGELIRRVGLVVPDQSWSLRASPRSLRVSGSYLELEVPLVPAGARAAARLKDFPLQVVSRVFPARVEELALETATRLDASLVPGDPASATARLELSAAGLVPTTSQPRSMRLTASLSPRHAHLEDLVVVDPDGVPRVRIHGGLSLDEETSLGIDLASLPMAWLEAFGLPPSALHAAHLVLDGRLGPFPAEAGERLVEVLPRWLEASHRERLRDLRGELRIQKLAVRDHEQEVARLQAPLVVHLRPDGLVVEPARLVVGGHGLELGGRLSHGTDSELVLRSDHVPLRALAEFVVEEVPEDLVGELNGTLRARGPLADPELAGTLTAAGMDLRIPYLISRLRGSLELRAAADGAHLRAPGLAVDGVPLALEAILPTTGPGVGSARASLRTTGLVLRRGRSRVGSIDASATATVDLARLAANLDARVEVQGGTLVLDDLGPVGLLRQALASRSAPGASAEATEATTASVPGAGRHRVHLQVKVPTPLLVRSPLVDAAAVADLTLDLRPGEPPFVEGHVRVTRGSVFLHRHEFKVLDARAEIRLAGGVLTSSLDARAEARVAEHRIRLVVRGTLEDPQVELTSVPSRTEGEITHLLATGTLPGQGGALSSAAQGVAEFFTTSSLNRLLSSSLGISSVRVRRDGDVSRFDVDKQLDDRTTVTYSRGTDRSDQLSIERRVGGTTTVEGGRKRDAEGARPFVGIKRRMKFR